MRWECFFCLKWIITVLWLFSWDKMAKKHSHLICSIWPCMIQFWFTIYPTSIGLCTGMIGLNNLNSHYYTYSVIALEIPNFLGQFLSNKHAFLQTKIFVLFSFVDQKKLSMYVCFSENWHKLLKFLPIKIPDKKNYSRNVLQMSQKYNSPVWSIDYVEYKKWLSSSTI